MDELQRSVTLANVDRFLDLLFVEPDPKTRAIYHDILISEEARFAALTERLTISIGRVRKWDHRIANHVAFMRNHPEQDAALMQQTLDNLQETRRILMEYQASIRDELERQSF